MKFCTLDLIRSNSCKVYTVIKIDLPPERRARLSSIGLTVGTEIQKLFVAPFGEPAAYEFKGSLFAIGKNDASKIYVRSEPKSR